jgi:hypothetical protein
VKRLIALAVILATPEGAFGQDPRAAAQENIVSSAAVSKATTPGYQLLLQGSIDKKMAIASGTWESDDGENTFEVKLSGPVDEDAKEVEPLTLDGLADSVTAEVTYQRFIWGYDDEMKNLRDLACELIDKHYSNCERKDFTENGQPAKRDIKAKYDAATPERRVKICSVLRAGGQDACDEAELKTANLYWAFQKLSGALEVPTIGGFTASIGRRKFEYIDPTTNESTSANHNGWTLGGHLGRYWRQAGYLAIRATLKSSWKAAESQPDEICRPVTGTPLTRCKVEAIGLPKKKTTGIGTIEYRRFISKGIALNPSFSYDFKNRIRSFVLPFYFLGDGKGLTGGARVGWTSEENELTFAVFVGARALNIIG